jgi:SpoVK/Ycf46/Vps4 family AAA+-type ATPase
MSEHDELQEILAREPEPPPQSSDDRMQRFAEILQMREAEASAFNEPRVSFTQWEIGPNDEYRATGATQPKLPAGVYRVLNTQRGIIFSRTFVLTDKLIDLKNSASSEIIEGIRTFWRSEDRFKKYGMLYKRGVLLWGPPGSGKTVTISLLINELISDGGMVILCDNPNLCVHALAQVRRIEPDRRLIVVEEDIEELMQHHGEHNLLALLDGENQIANVVHVATTNYPEELGARIINRPSRFDEVKKIGMPNELARLAYFQATVPAYGGIDISLSEWVTDTEGMSIAHLRELVVSVLCLQRDYRSTIDRLKRMQIRPKSHEDGFKRRSQIGVRSSAVNGHE